MVLQVKTMSSHHRLAGTRQWNTSESLSCRWSWTTTLNDSPQSGQEASIWPSTCRAAQIPNASQAQFVYHQRFAARTRKAVGTAQNGLAIRICEPAALSTSAC
jgi:hypothetical protein